MSTNDIKQAVLNENEFAFSHKGYDYLLYGWDQCDGYVLSLESNGELVWQDYIFSVLDSCCNTKYNNNIKKKGVVS